MICLLLLTTAMTVVAQNQQATGAYTDIYKEYTDDPDVHIFTSNIDYTELAKEITAGCTDDYQRVKAIYEWMCKNIDYDLSFSIHRADSCLLMRKGVCQAYCDLFYRLAEPLKIRVEPIDGYAKGMDGRIAKDGHTWLFVYTQEKRGILLDPTWGAGGMVDGKYVKNADCLLWFNVEPEWMMLTHYPNLDVYQLIDQPITMREFRDLPMPNPLWREYGLDGKMLFRLAKEGALSLPVFYNGGERQFKIVDIPLCDSLTIGQDYTFRIKMLNDRAFCVRNNREYNMSADWQSEGNGVYSINFMPRDSVRLTIGLKDPVKANYWNTMLEYPIKPATAADWARVEQRYPLCVPDARAVGTIDGPAWEQAGYDGHRLLQIIREQKIQELPTIYSDKGQKFKIVEVPMNKQLKRNQEYVFRIKPESGMEWAVVNGSEWFGDWDVENGVYTLEVTPRKLGMMMLCVKMKGDQSQFVSCLMYDVTK